MSEVHEEHRVFCKLFNERQQGYHWKEINR